MKKIICILTSLLVMGTASFAQNKDTKKAPPKTTAPATKKSESTAVKPGTTVPKKEEPKTKATPLKPGTTVPKKEEPKTKAAPVKPGTTTLKKDGTPDMRMKENKAAAKTAGPLKKDGTPDMRYKSNRKDVPQKKQ